ncbi:MAG: histidinol-phosphate transaminase [Syntrophobacteraceae bacterium]
MKPCAPEHIASIIPYPPGKPLEELEREYGISDSIKLASNENPLGPSPKAVAAIRECLCGLHRYPDGSGYYLRKRLSGKFNLPFEGIVLGNGSNEIIELAIRTFIQPLDEVILPAPSFLLYQLSVQTMGGKAIPVPLKEFAVDLDKMAEAVTPRTKIIFVNNPNNPTGTTVSQSDFDRFLDRIPPHVIIVLDEAYIEFARDPDTPRGFDYVGRKGPYLMVLRTFSKVYGLAGLRIGYGVMDPSLADYLNRVRQPFNTGSLAQAAALAALDDEEFLRRTQTAVWDGMDYLYGEIERLGLPYLPSQSNFFIIKVPCDAKKLFDAMLRQGVIIRAMNSYGMARHIRVNAGLEAENKRFIRALGHALENLRDSTD